MADSENCFLKAQNKEQGAGESTASDEELDIHTHA
jgi:hypothetical protein